MGVIEDILEFRDTIVGGIQDVAKTAKETTETISETIKFIKENWWKILIGVTIAIIIIIIFVFIFIIKPEQEQLMQLFALVISNG